MLLKRFLLYGCAGWVVEVGFTGISSALVERDRSATARTYLWMHPIYGAAGLLLEFLSKRLRFLPRGLRALMYLPVIYGAEFTTGWLLCRVLGKCPWDYGTKGINYKGYIRLDYVPFWYLAGLAFEPAAKRVHWAALAPRHSFWRHRAFLR